LNARAVIYAMSGRRPSVCASGGALAFYTFVQRSRRLINRCQRKERELHAGKIAQVAGGFTSGGVAQFNARARWLKTRSTCLTDPVTGQFTVECLIANTLLDRPKNLMLSHTGD
jgi:hypothetical protein